MPNTSEEDQDKVMDEMMEMVEHQPGLLDILYEALIDLELHKRRCRLNPYVVFRGFSYEFNDNAPAA